MKKLFCCSFAVLSPYSCLRPAQTYPTPHTAHNARLPPVLPCLQALDSYQALWAQLEDIDRHTQLLDPPQALAHPYASCSRCIALGNGASCQLQLSAAAPRGMPAVVFHGPSSIVARLQAAWYGGAAQQWDEQQSVRENLQEVLQVSRQQQQVQQQQQEGCRSGFTCGSSSSKGLGIPGVGISLIASGSPGLLLLLPYPMHLMQKTSHACRSSESLQVQLPAPKPGSKRGCAAAASAAGASGIEQAEAAAGSEADDASDDDYDMAEDGACCICYSLHLPDPAHPDQIGGCSATAVACGCRCASRAAQLNVHLHLLPRGMSCLHGILYLAGHSRTFLAPPSHKPVPLLFTHTPHLPAHWATPAGAAPSVTCPGASCSRVFHAMCLAEWLGALPTSRRVFDTLFGSCPFCNGPIGVSTRPAAH